MMNTIANSVDLIDIKGGVDETKLAKQSAYVFCRWNLRVSEVDFDSHDNRSPEIYIRMVLKYLDR